jgi:hypothetical protein
MAKVLELALKIVKADGDVKKIAEGVRDLNSEVKHGSGLIEKYKQIIDELNKKLRDTERTTKEVAKAKDGLGAAVSDGATKLDVFKVALGGVITTLSLAVSGSFQLANNVALLAEQQSNTAARLGLTVKEVGLFSAAAEDAHVNVSALTTLMRTFSDAINENSSEGQRGKEILKEIGISARDGAGNLRPIAQIFLEIGDAVSKANSVAEKQNILKSLFGRAGIELLPLFNSGLREAIEEQKQLGTGMSDIAANRAKKFDDAIDALSRRMKNLKVDTGLTILEILRFGGILQNMIAGGGPTAGAEKIAVFGKDTSNFGEFAPGASMKISDRKKFVARSAALNSFMSTLGDKDELARAKKELDRVVASLGEAPDAKDLARATKARDEFDTIKKRIEAAKELEHAATQVTHLWDQMTVAEVDGLAKINVQRDVALEKLGKTKELIAEINEVFDRMLVAERKKILADALEIPKETLLSLHTGLELTKKITEAAGLLQQRNMKKFLESTGQLSKPSDIAFGAEAFKKESDHLKSTLERAIRADEKFLTESRKVVEAFREIDEARLATSLSEARADANRTERLIALTTETGGEVGAASKISGIKSSVARKAFAAEKELAQVRLDSALIIADTEEEMTAARLRHEAEMIKANARLREDLLDAEFSKVEQIMELRRKEVEEFRSSAGQVFDAATREGSTGIKSFLTGYIRTIQRTLFINSSEELFKSMRDKFKFALPGQTDGAGNLSLLGRVLRGTPFGVDPAKIAQEMNTNATRDNTFATRELSRTIKGNGLGGGISVGGIGDELGIFGSDVGGIFGGSGIVPGLGKTTGKSSGVSSFFNNLSTGLASVFTGAGLFGGFKGGDRSIQLGEGRATTASAQGQTSTTARVGNIVASGAAVVTGAIGAAQGFQSGGAKGITQGVGSVLGTASLIPGPQQPFVAGAAALAGLISFMLGDRRKEFDEKVTSALSKNRVDPRVGQDRLTDLTGNEVDYDFRGRARVVVVQNVSVNVDTMDARSFEERSDLVGNAITREIGRGNGPLRASIQQAALS